MSGAGGRTTALAADGLWAVGGTGLAGPTGLAGADSGIDEGAAGSDGDWVAEVDVGRAVGVADG